MIEVAQQAATTDMCPFSRGIDTRPAQHRQINLHAAVTGRFSREAVAAALDRQQQPTFACKRYGCGYIPGAARLYDQGWITVDGWIQDATRLVVAVTSGQQEVAAQCALELFQRGLLDGYLVPSASAADDARRDGGERLHQRRCNCVAGEGGCNASGQRHAQEIAPFHIAPLLCSYFG